jgi:hypothetical protein
VAQDAPDGEARSEHVAEAKARAVRARDIDRGGEEDLVALELTPQRFDLVFAAAAGQVVEADIHFLQAQDIGIGDPACFACDASRVDDAVDAAAPLHVPRREPHCYFRGSRCSFAGVSSVTPDSMSARKSSTMPK